jgi:hypothetical protein
VTVNELGIPQNGSQYDSYAGSACWHRNSGLLARAHPGTHALHTPGLKASTQTPNQQDAQLLTFRCIDNGIVRSIQNFFVPI